METAQVTINRETFKKTNIKSGWKSFFSSRKALSSSLSNQRKKCLRFYLCNHKFLLGFWWRCASVALIFMISRASTTATMAATITKKHLKFCLNWIEIESLTRKQTSEIWIRWQKKKSESQLINVALVDRLLTPNQNVMCRFIHGLWERMVRLCATAHIHDEYTLARTDYNGMLISFDTA